MKNSGIVTIAFLFFSMGIMAHPKGHYSGKDLSGLHRWDIKINNRPVIGNFLMSRGDRVFIEGVHGKMWDISFSSLKGKDRHYVENEIATIRAINTLPHLEIPKAHHDIQKSYDLGRIFIFTLLTLLFAGLAYYTQKVKSAMEWRLIPASMAVCSLVVSIISCKKETGSGNDNSGNIPRTSVYFMDSVFEPYKPALATSWDTNYFYVASDGIPNHNMMIGISSWQQQVPIPQDYTGNNSWSIPLQPSYAATPLSTRTNLMKGAVAIAANGIPIFNALNNRGEDAFAIGELDNWGGHCGKGDDYHYHAAPLSLQSNTGRLPIAFALDGFAVYGSKEPDGSAMEALDTCHGHVYHNGVYHYHGTNSYPYVIGAMKGKVTLDPNTPAPENQIIPQAFAHPVRPALTPLRGAVITDFTAPAVNTYNLTFRIGTKPGHVNYNWDANGNYHFTFIDTAGMTSTANYP